MYNFKVGDEFEVGFYISEDIYNGFVKLFKDENLLHTNEQFAVEHGFAGRVMQGNILNGFISYFVGECLPDKKVLIHSQTIKYKYPVYLDDNLTFKSVVAEIHSSVKVAVFKFKFINQDLKAVATGQIQIGLLK
ncbi:hypothetical protein DYU05_09380 [Mucilaginibacter terrenus]|uniref:Uncharacterized protein n=1 Tax=Mucilaginibacter terrenus TaxID=2482727 RepID=A0A3E2NXN4_9SPHI|nr:MaoC/PaaZ C-terminal domain-containing protein [Mucilaginibacter terrenus]RFZ85786.1 hypothetical protein DYU05_09380 [Mucilaginibacter terrenus]